MSTALAVPILSSKLQIQSPRRLSACRYTNKKIIMKKIALPTFLIVFLISSTAFAQIENYGLKIGAQSAGAYSDPLEVSRVTGFSIYGFADVKLTSNLFSTLDLGYTQRGYTTSQEETGPSGQRIQTVEATSKLSYITFAPFLNLPVESTPIYFGAAPRFDFLVSTSPGKYEFTSVTVEDSIPENLDDFVFGGSVVMGIKDLSISNANFRVEAKYEVDITNSADSPGKYRNNALMVVLGVAI